ncbi:protein of unknown function (plasmid) [Caballeronia sp. S22]
MQKLNARMCFRALNHMLGGFRPRRYGGTNYLFTYEYDLSIMYLHS